MQFRPLSEMTSIFVPFICEFLSLGLEQFSLGTVICESLDKDVCPVSSGFFLAWLLAFTTCSWLVCAPSSVAV